MDIQIIAQCGFINVLSNGHIVNTQHDVPERTTKHVSFVKRTLAPVAVAQTTALSESASPITQTVSKTVSPGITLVKKSVVRDEFADHMSLMGVSAL